MNGAVTSFFSQSLDCEKFLVQFYRVPFQNIVGNTVYVLPASPILFMWIGNDDSFLSGLPVFFCLSLLQNRKWETQTNLIKKVFMFT